jgi:hypothetical protein
MNSLRSAIRASLVVLAILCTANFAPAQMSTRQLLASGAGVPEHSGFAFGPFSHLSMNRAKQIVFLSSMVSPRNQLIAVVRSAGVSFNVIAFQGLRSPVGSLSFDSFSAPSMNGNGQVAFSATLRENENGQPAGAGVFRATGSKIEAVATTDESPPAGSNFVEFAAPIISSEGNVLFSARTAQGTGLYLWTPGGIQNIALPPGLGLKGQDLLDPILTTEDQAVLVERSISRDMARTQLFRALAEKLFQGLNPPPPPEQTAEILAAQPGAKPVPMLLVALEAGKAEVVIFQGDPAQAVQAKLPAGGTLKPFGQVEGQAGAPGGNILVAATSANQPNDLGLYCYCDGGVQRLTTPDDFAAIAGTLAGRPLDSLTSDAVHTAAFIAPTGPGDDANAIYVTALPW